MKLRELLRAPTTRSRVNTLERRLDRVEQRLDVASRALCDLRGRVSASETTLAGVDQKIARGVDAAVAESKRDATTLVGPLVLHVDDLYEEIVQARRNYDYVARLADRNDYY